MAERIIESPQVEITQDSILRGPRQLGEVSLGNGAVAVHEVTPDGMKQARISGEPYRSAAEFHREAGVAQPYELEKAAQTEAPALTDSAV